MIIDCHVHLAGSDTRYGNLWRQDACSPLVVRALARRLGLAPSDIFKPGADDKVAGILCQWLAQSRLDAAVFLAMDAIYLPDGTRDVARTRMVVANDYVADLAAAHPKVLFGASIHPYRHDAIPELERLAARGACLVKWLPSVQDIQPDHPRCLPFYDALARLRMPLLCHSGKEHTLSGVSQDLNAVERLVPALERGVTVIAAHCATSVFPHERGTYGAWENLALQYENLYGDISAFGFPTRVAPLHRMLRNPQLCRKLLYGSDFPVAFFPISFLFRTGFRRWLELRRIRNPFDQALDTMRAAGVPEPVFSLAGSLLRIPR